MAHLNLDIGILAYEDQPITSAPQRRPIDWLRSFRGLSIRSPGTNTAVPTIPPGGSATLLQGERTITADNSTTYALTQSLLSGQQYFLSWTAGTAPGFRTDRGLTLSGSTLTVTPQANQSVIFSITAGGGSFAAVQVGDQVFIPGITTGVAPGPFNPLNEGLWVVLSVTSSTAIVLARLPNSTLAQFGQTGAVVTDNLQFQAFSAAGVQVGDEVDISAGATLPSPLVNTFEIVGVTAQQLTLVSTAPLPLVTAFIPTAAGLTVYSQAFNFLYIEADQPCVVQANGDTGNTQRLDPVQASQCWCSNGASPLVGVYLKTGPTWELTVVNRSVNPLHLFLATAQ
jgi:hypothetical protein